MKVYLFCYKNFYFKNDLAILKYIEFIEKYGFVFETLYPNLLGNIDNVRIYFNELGYTEELKLYFKKYKNITNTLIYNLNHNTDLKSTSQDIHGSSRQFNLMRTEDKAELAT